MAFVLKKKIDLSSFGEDWKDCYVEFNSPTWEQIKGLHISESSQEETVISAIDLLKKLFISGKGFDGNNIMPIGVDDIPQLPLLILNHCFAELAGQLSPKETGS